jgi:FG-GAP repeat
VALAPDGRIIVAGSADAGGGDLDFAVVGLQSRVVNYFAAGGFPSLVRVFDLARSQVAAFTVFPGFPNLLNVATGDVNGDGIDDLAVGAGVGNPHVKVYDGRAILAGTISANPDAAILSQFFAYGAGFNVGVFVAIGDVDGDGRGEVITGASPGNPHTKIVRGSAVASGAANGKQSEPTNNTLEPFLMGQFFAYGLGFNVGATVAAGDFDRDGFADVVTGASRGNPHTKIIRGSAIAAGQVNGLVSESTGNTLEPFVIGQVFPFALNFNVGSNVAAGDVNGDGFIDLVAGANVGNPNVRVYTGTAIQAGAYVNGGDPNANLLADFFAFAVGQNIGASVVVPGDLDADGLPDVLTGQTVGSPLLRAFRGNSFGLAPAFYEALVPGITGGIAVG